jgi:hypothetical protein
MSRRLVGMSLSVKLPHDVASELVIEAAERDMTAVRPKHFDTFKIVS